MSHLVNICPDLCVQVEHILGLKEEAHQQMTNTTDNVEESGWEVPSKRPVKMDLHVTNFASKEFELGQKDAGKSGRNFHQGYDRNMNFHM